MAQFAPKFSIAHKVKYIDEALEIAVGEFAKAAATVIIKEAPVWSGQYVASIDVETGEIATAYPRYDMIGVKPKMSDSEIASFKESKHDKLVAEIKMQVKAGAKTIHLNNAAPHALIVEAKYAPYSQARAWLKGTAANIVKVADAYLQKKFD
jgi:hypothetical protein